MGEDQVKIDKRNSDISCTHILKKIISQNGMAFYTFLKGIDTLDFVSREETGA